jgi:hypothetical protein
MKLRAIRRRESMSEWPSLTLFREPTGQIAPPLHQDVITVIHTVDFSRLAPQRAKRERELDVRANFGASSWAKRSIGTFSVERKVNLVCFVELV